MAVLTEWIRALVLNSHPVLCLLKKQGMHGNRISFMLKLICLTEVTKSRWKSYASYWKYWLFKKYCGTLKVKQHFLKRKLMKTFDTEKWQVKTTILSVKEFGELTEWSELMIKKNNNWIWKDCHVTWICSRIFSLRKIPKCWLYFIFRCSP